MTKPPEMKPEEPWVPCCHARSLGVGRISLLGGLVCLQLGWSKLSGLSSSDGAYIALDGGNRLRDTEEGCGPIGRFAGITTDDLGNLAEARVGRDVASYHCWTSSLIFWRTFQVEGVVSLRVEILCF